MTGPESWHHPLNAPTPAHGRVTLVPYDERWPGLFERERARIVAALGDRQLGVHHIGSTSVPGLAAKPIIDILLVVADAADDDAFVPSLEAAGYVLRVREPDPTPGSSFTGREPHRVFKGADIDLNLHVWSQGSTEIDRYLTFRDWLRRHPDDRALYECIKHALASQQWDNVQQYAEAKTAVVKGILARAGGYPMDDPTGD